MTARDSQQFGRLRLRHLLESTEASGEAMQDEAPRFHRLAREDAAPRVVSSFNLFQTPEPLATRLAAILLEHRPGLGRTLEPSAGLGRLYRAARAAGCGEVVLVEQAAECCGELYRATEGDLTARLVQGDFLEQSPGLLGLFDSVIMNPPFKMGRDIKHIDHARKFLAPCGRLVALCANGPRQRAKLMPKADSWIELPPGSFRSEGTGVEAAIVIFNA